MQCTHQSRNGTCLASCSSLYLSVGLFLGPALTRQSATTNSFSPSISCPSPSDISSRSSSSTPFNCVSSLHSTLSLCCFTSAQCCWPYRLVESILTTDSPCQLKTGPVSSRQNPHAHCVHTIFQVQLDHRSVSSVSNVRIHFVQHYNVSSSYNLFLH